MRDKSTGISPLLASLSDRRIIILLIVLITVVVSLQSYFTPHKAPHPEALKYTAYNNYIIFKQSGEHLWNQQNLYVLYPEEHWDLYKYTPTFALLFSPLTFLPDGLGLIIWNLLNALVLLAALYSLPRFTDRQKGLMILILLVDLITSLQNEQSNALMAGLMLLGFSMLEKNRYLPATLFLVLSVYIKLFGIVAVALYAFYPKRGQLILYTLAWMVVFLALPLIALPVSTYMEAFVQYGQLLSQDHHATQGFSVMDLLQPWTSLNAFHPMVVLAGGLILVVPLLRIKAYPSAIFRYYFMAAILMWVVIFNHKAESPTFVIAMTGVALWFMNSLKSRLNWSLLIIALLLTSLSASDIFPAYLRHEIIVPYALKALPITLIWIKTMADLLTQKSATSS